MSTCEAQLAGVSDGIAAALRGVDCLAAETTAMAFGRLFGSGGALLPVLTIVLTLYVAFFALSLLTGRSTLGLSALTPRMMTLGLVLTFATSWVAYQGVVWNLAVGGPDQIAGLLMGTTGSATQMFADRIDIVFAAIAEAAKSAGGGDNAAAGTFTPPNLVWLAAILLLLGTVGILVTARIALAVLIALGPIFVIFALFPATRGLFAGWLRGVVLLAIAPLFAVLCGGLTLELAVPVIASLRGPEGIDGRSAMALFLIGAVHVSLMSMVMKVAGTMVAGWKVFGMAASPEATSAAAVAAGASNVQVLRDGSDGQAAAATTMTPSRRALGIAAAPIYMPANDTAGAAPGRRDTRIVTQTQTAGEPAAAVHAISRARGIGSRFRAAPARSKEMLR